MQSIKRSYGCSCCSGRYRPGQALIESKIDDEPEKKSETPQFSVWQCLDCSSTNGVSLKACQVCRQVKPEDAFVYQTTERPVMRYEKRVVAKKAPDASGKHRDPQPLIRDSQAEPPPEFKIDYIRPPINALRLKAPRAFAGKKHVSYLRDVLSKLSTITRGDLIPVLHLLSSLSLFLMSISRLLGCYRWPSEPVCGAKNPAVRARCCIHCPSRTFGATRCG